MNVERCQKNELRCWYMGIGCCKCTYIMSTYNKIQDFEHFEFVIFRSFWFMKLLIFSLKTYKFNSSLTTYVYTYELEILEIGFHNFCLWTVVRIVIISLYRFLFTQRIRTGGVQKR